MQRLTRILAGPAIVGLMAALAACTVDSRSTASTDGDTIKIGVTFDQPGLGWKAAAGAADPTGFDIEVARYVAHDLGYSDVKFVEAPTAERETLIEEDKVDLVIAAYSITDARKKLVSFAGPYLVAGQDLLVPVNSDVTGPDALNGRTVCSVSQSTAAQKIKDDYSKDVHLQEAETYAQCIDSLTAGAVDAVTADNVILAGYASQPQYAGKLKVVGEPFSTERYGVGLKLGDVGLCTRVNEALTRMISSGEWQQAFDRALGVAGFVPDPAENPPTLDACT